jgi:hypothetical protein
VTFFPYRLKIFRHILQTLGSRKYTLAPAVSKTVNICETKTLLVNRLLYLEVAPAWPSRAPRVPTYNKLIVWTSDSLVNNTARLVRQSHKHVPICKTCPQTRSNIITQTDLQTCSSNVRQDYRRVPVSCSTGPRTNSNNLSDRPTDMFR